MYFHFISTSTHFFDRGITPFDRTTSQKHCTVVPRLSEASPAVPRPSKIAQCFWESFEGVRDFKFPWCGGLLHVSRRLFWRYWPSITLNFDTVIKRNCLIQFLQNLMALDGSLNVIQNGQTKFCCLVHGKYTPLIENSYLVISGLLLFYKFNFSAFGLQVSRRSCG